MLEQFEIDNAAQFIKCYQQDLAKATKAYKQARAAKSEKIEKMYAGRIATLNAKLILLSDHA